MKPPIKRPNITFAEQFEDINIQKNRKLRIAALHKYSSPELKQLLDYAFNPNITWLLPEGLPPYKQLKEDAGSLTKGLLRNMQKLPIFLNIGLPRYKNLTDGKRENIFINLLAMCHPKDVQLLGEIKSKKLESYKNITPDLIKEAFPGFTKAWVKKEDGKDVQKSS